SLAVLVALTVSGVLFASQEESNPKCDKAVGAVCKSAQGCVCYFFLKEGGSGEANRSADRCFYRDHDFLDVIGGGEGQQ
ncbi:MAG: hypothetical protein RR555_09485, partial [Bacteroidales bacterium]